MLNQRKISFSVMSSSLIFYLLIHCCTAFVLPRLPIDDFGYSDSSMQNSSNYCYTSDESPYLFFSSKTAYEYTRGNFHNDQLPDTCKPIQLWAFIRHGTRNPGPTEIARFSRLGEILQKIRENYKRGRVTLCKEDYKFLNTWKWNATISQKSANDLVLRGHLDMMGLALRLQRYFPELLNDSCGTPEYYFQHTKTDRTKKSFQSFIGGLFCQNCTVDVYESDEVIKEYLKCQMWNLDDTNGEYEKFTESTDYQAMATRVSRRLGFEQILNSSLIETIYLECAYEKAWNISESSKWCAAFIEEDLMILEYSQDLKSYYKSGYGREYKNKNLGCPIMKDLYTRLQNTIKGLSHEPKATFYFSHSKSLHQLLTALGLYKDDIPLKGNNYRRHTRREWRASFFGQFASSVIVVLYKCTDTEDPFQIELSVGEKVESICSTGKLCSWGKFSEMYRDLGNACDLSFCKL